MDTTDATLPRLLNRERFEREFPIKWRTLLAWERHGILKLTRLGRLVFVDRDQLIALIESGGKQFAGGWRRQPNEP